MQISMFMVRVRFVSDGKGPLEAKPRRDRGRGADLRRAA